MFRCWYATLVLLCSAATAVAQPADDGRWHSGPYAFSDELGGFRILSVAGAGTRSDPVILVQELTSASPVTLVIQAAMTINPQGKQDEWATGMIHMRVETVNNSGLAWTGFSFELQEERGVPSTFGDGLSFDQRKLDSDNIGMDSFATYERLFEPYDRLEFIDGHVDPLARATFRFFISDFTPRKRFYLLQDPQIPFS